MGIWCLELFCISPLRITCQLRLYTRPTKKYVNYKCDRYTYRQHPILLEISRCLMVLHDAEKVTYQHLVLFVILSTHHISKHGISISSRPSYLYSWIACQLDIGASLGCRHNLVRFQIWDHFWIPRPKLHGATNLIFLVKPNNGIVWPVFACCLKHVFSRFFFCQSFDNWAQ